MPGEENLNGGKGKAGAVSPGTGPGAEIPRKRDAGAGAGGEGFPLSLIEKSFDLLAVVDREGNLLYVSPSLQSLLGYRPEEVIGMNAYPYIHPDDLPQVTSFFVSGLSREGFSRYITFRLRHRDGTWRSFEAVGNNLLHDPTVRGIVVNARDVTDRVTLEEGLREAEERYRAVLDSVNEAILIHDLATGELVYHNRRAGEMFGDPPEALRSLPTRPSPSDDSWTALFSRMARRAAEVGPQLYECASTDSRGDTLWVEVNQKRVTIGNRECVLSTLRDIAERKKAVEALKESEEYYRAITEQAFDIISVVDEKGYIRYTSPSAYRVLGRNPEEVTGRDATINIHPEDVPGLRKLLAEAVKKPGLKVGFRYRVRHADGSWRTMAAVGHNLLHHPSVRGIVVHSTDITEQEELQERLARSEEYFRSLIESASDIIMVIESDGTLRYVSPSVEKASGYSPEEIVGKKLYHFTHPEDLEQASQVLAAASRKRGASVYQEVRIRHKDGTWHYYEASAINQLDNPFIGGLVITARDIDERKEEERFTRVQRDLAVVLGTAQNAGEALEKALDFIMRATEALGGAAFLLDADSGELSPVRSSGLSLDAARKRGAFAADSPLCRMVSSGETVENLNVADLFGEAPGEGERWGPALLLPVKHEEGVEGALLLVSEAGNPVSPRRRERAEILVGQLGQALGRLRLLAALKESEEKYRLIFDFSGEAVFTYDTEMRIIDVNRKACELIGYPEEELVGRKIFEVGILHPGDYETGWRNNQKLMRGEQVRAELRFIRKDGVVLVGEVTGAPLFDREGRVAAVINIARDITEKKREEKMRDRLNQCLLSLGADPMENIKRSSRQAAKSWAAT
jgi:PAS domain S-box-containing protein